MASSFVEQIANSGPQSTSRYSISTGVVQDNLNILSTGMVQVRVSSLPAMQLWCRVVSVGGGPSRGFMWLPQVDDEVLVAFNQNDERDAFLLGGLWNSEDRPPIGSPTDFMSKRIIKTGISSAPGHTVEFDDALQSIKVTTSTQQTLTMDVTKITLAAPQNALSVTLDLGPPPAITIQSTAGNITLSAPAGKISIQGLSVEVTSTSTLDLNATGPCSIQGLPVKIN